MIFFISYAKKETQRRALDPSFLHPKSEEKMAYLDRKDLGAFGPLLGPRFLEDKIRSDIQICWLLQDPAKRNVSDVRNAIIGILDNELKDIDSILKELGM